MADVILDTKGLQCPWPILKVGKAIREIPSGSTIEVLATDPGAVSDFHDYSEATGHKLLEWGEEDGIYRFVLQKVPRDE